MVTLGHDGDLDRRYFAGAGGHLGFKLKLTPSLFFIGEGLSFYKVGRKESFEDHNVEATLTFALAEQWEGRLYSQYDRNQWSHGLGLFVYF